MRTPPVLLAAAAAAVALLCGPSVAAAPLGTNLIATALPAAAPPARELTEDQNTAGYSVDTTAETGVYRTELVVPLVTCDELHDGGLYPHLTVAGGVDHTYARVFMLFACLDGVMETDFVVDGSGGDYRPTLVAAPGDALRWTIRDEVGSSTVVLRNLTTGEQEKFPLGVINPGWAAVGQGLPWPGADVPAFEAYGGFSRVRFGATAPRTWTHLDVYDLDGTTVLLDTISTGRRSFDVAAATPPPPPPPPTHLG